MKTAARVDCGGDDGEENLLCAENGRGAGAHAFVAASHDIFQHDDRIVDNKACGKHQRQQRQDVDREAGKIDRSYRTDQRYGHGKRRDQRRAPVSRKTKMTTSTIETDSASAISTSWIAPLTKMRHRL